MKLFFLVAFLSSVSAAFEVPRTLSGGHSNFSGKALGDACYSLRAEKFNLPCNPAFLKSIKDPQYFTHLFAGQNVDYYENVQDIIDNSATSNTVERVFNQNRSSELEADLAFGYLRDSWGISLSPSRLTYYSMIRNRPMPYVSVFAAQEQILRAQYTKDIGDEFTLGFELKGINRKLVLNEFFLADALVEGGADRVLPVRSQQALYVEPALVWKPSGLDYSPKVSAMVTQLGYVSQKYEELRTGPEGQLGVSLIPPLGENNLEVGIHLTSHAQTDRVSELAKLAATYERDWWLLAGSVGEKQNSFGAQVAVGILKAGISYDHRRFDNVLGRNDKVSTWYLEVGLGI